MKSFKQVAEELVPKFQRATKTDVHYTGQINGKTFVVPHAFHADGKTTPMRHAIVVSPTHVLHNNPTLTPEESARVHSHIKDIHGGQDLANLDEDRQLALHLGMTKSDKKEPSKEVPEVKKAETHYKQTHKLVPGTPEHQAERDTYRHAALAASRQAATLAFAKKHHIIKERTITTGSLKFNKIANNKPVTYNSFGKIVKEGLVVHGRAQTYDTVAKKWKVDEKRYRVGSDNRKLALNHILKKLKKDYPHHHEHEATIEGDKTHMDFYKESAMLNEGRPIRGDVFSHHQTLIAKKTLRMPDAMLGVMGGPSKEDSRKHLKKIGWTQKQIHDHEHAQFTEEANMVQEHVWNVTDHLGHTHSVEAKDHSEAMKKTVSVGGVHPQGIPMTQWHKVRVERKNLEERTLTTGEDAKKEEIVHSMKKKLQGFKERYGKDAKSVMYATATKQAKGLAEDAAQIDEISIGLAQRVHDKRNAQGDALVARAARPQYATQSRAITKKAAEKFKKADISFNHIMKKVFHESEQLDESFMGTYTRNENANRHTANIVHLAKHFGNAADQAQAKFYADELKKHGHNIHHEAQYKLHEKLWPFAVAAHHMKEEVQHLEEGVISGLLQKMASHPHYARNIDSLAGTVHNVHVARRVRGSDVKKHFGVDLEPLFQHGSKGEPHAWVDKHAGAKDTYSLGHPMRANRQSFRDDFKASTKKVSEEVGQLNELSKSTLKNYVKKATIRLKKDEDFRHDFARSAQRVKKTYDRKIGNREAGIDHASEKLGEEVQLNELSDAAKNFVHHREEHWKHAKLNRHAQDRTAAKFHSNEMQKHFHTMTPDEKYRAHTGSWVSSPSRRLGGGSAKEDKEYVHESEQLNELKVPKVPFMQKHLLGANLRDTVGRVHDMGHHELKSLHHHYEKHPAQSVVQAQQHRSIKKALRKFGDPQGTHNPVDKKKFVKRDLKENEHSETFITVKRVLGGD